MKFIDPRSQWAIDAQIKKKASLRRDIVECDREIERLKKIKWPPETK